MAKIDAATEDRRRLIETLKAHLEKGRFSPEALSEDFKAVKQELLIDLQTLVKKRYDSYIEPLRKEFSELR